MTDRVEFWQIAACAEALLLICVVGVGLFLKAKYKKLSRIQQQVHRADLETERQKLESVMNLSHDIRTLLNVIMGSQQLLELYLNSSGELERERLKRHIGIIRENADRLSRLISWLLEAAKQASGSHHIRLIAYNIVEIVENVVMSMQDYAESRGLALYFYTSQEEIILSCDRYKIEAVMLNLLSNAIKYTKAGGNVTVSIREKADEAVITVKDTGVGIPDSEQQRVFERYVQLNDRQIPHTEGSGIGLCAVKSMVELHGGSISVISEHGKGSEFIVELPISGQLRPDKESLCVHKALDN